MKRFFVILAAVFLLLPACSNRDEIRTEQLYLEEDIPYSEGSAFHLALKYDVEFPTAGFPKEVLEKVRRNIRIACFGEAYADFTAPVEELAQAYRNVELQDYRTSNEELLKEMEITEAEAANLNWGFDVLGEFHAPYGDALNYWVEHYDYMGGAHGMYSMTPIVIDRTSGDVLSYEAFTEGVGRERLMALIDKHKFNGFDDDPDIDKDQIFYVEQIEPSKTFTVGPEGLTFIYQPYDVAPYVFGVITITIPWEDLQ